MPGFDNRKKHWYDLPGLLPGRLVKWLVLLAVIPVVLGIVLGIYAWRAGKYDLDQVLAPLENSVAYDAQGALIGTLSDEARVNVGRVDLPDNLVNAFVAREDEDFFDHGGIVYMSMFRSMLKNITTLSFAQGGSTITMQLARNTFELRDKTIDRKILEIAIARRIEAKYDKDTILTSYLNRIYFGQQCYGIAQAARFYFGKEVRALDLSECATLAGIVRGPSIFNPVDDYQAAVRQRDATLDRMVESGFISGEQAARTKAEPLTIKADRQRQMNSYPIMWINREMEYFDDGIDLEISSIFVLTTFDLNLQRNLELLVEPKVRALELSSLWKGMPKRENNELNGCLQVAALCFNPQNGDVLAVTGGRCPLDGVDRWAVERKPGRLFLPFVNLAAAARNRNIIRNTPVATGRAAGYAKVTEIAGLLDIKGRLPVGDELYEGLFQAPLLSLVRGIAMIQQKGNDMQLASVKQVGTNRKNLIFNRGNTSLRGELFPRESVFVISSMPPFKLDARRKNVSLNIELPDYNGRFHGIIGRNRAVVLWVGFDEAKEESWKQKGIRRAVEQLGSDIVEEMYAKMTDG